MNKLFLLSLVLVSCSTQVVEPKEPMQEKTTPSYFVEEPVCEDELGDTVECLENSDCCDDFYCGVDPERSYRTKYCLWNGK